MKGVLALMHDDYDDKLTSIVLLIIEIVSCV